MDRRGAVTTEMTLSSNRAWELVGAMPGGRRRPSAHHHERMDADAFSDVAFTSSLELLGAGT